MIDTHVVGLGGRAVRSPLDAQEDQATNAVAHPPHHGLRYEQPRLLQHVTGVRRRIL
jgi:hypothetical protein